MHRFLAIFLGIILLAPSPTQAQDEAVNRDVLIPDPAFAEALPADEYYRATVLEILEEGENEFGGQSQPWQLVRIQLTNSQETEERIEIEHGTTFTIQPHQLVEGGDEVIVTKSYKIDGSSYYFITDRYRLPLYGWFLGLFAVLVVLFAGWRGASSFAGLALSVAILGGFIVPRIIAGDPPLLISIIGAGLIATLSIYLAHGFTKSTSVAVASTVLSLMIAGLLAHLAVAAAGLSGAGSEDAYNLQFSQNIPFDLRGLLLGGMIIGALGVLDDITTAQAAAVQEIKRANSALGWRELYERGLRVGREHITSLVNTLVLAYAGASLPLFLVFSQTQFPWWVAINTEFVAEEVVRTLVGSTALVLAVPIVTGLAALVFTRSQPGPTSTTHVH